MEKNVWLLLASILDTTNCRYLKVGDEQLMALFKISLNNGFLNPPVSEDCKPTVTPKGFRFFVHRTNLDRDFPHIAALVLSALPVTDDTVTKESTAAWIKCRDYLLMSQS